MYISYDSLSFYISFVYTRLCYHHHFLSACILLIIRNHSSQCLPIILICMLLESNYMYIKVWQISIFYNYSMGSIQIKWVHFKIHFALCIFCYNWSYCKYFSFFVSIIKYDSGKCTGGFIYFYDFFVMIW